MDKWRYRITTHTTADVLGALPVPVEEVPPTMFCDDEGMCYFDAGPNPFTQAMERLLDGVGEEGWELKFLRGAKKCPSLRFRIL